jgi:1,2-diacylglycerol 3-alpha-glucosyltransferase
MLKLCILFWRLGPYHHARLRAAGQQGQVTAVELTGIDDIYAWDTIDGADSFQRETLFSESGDSPKQVAEIRRRMFAALDRIQPDVVAIPGWSFPDALAALSWSIQAGKPTVLMSESQGRDHRRNRLKESVKRRIVQLNSAGLVGGASHVDYLCDLGMQRDHIFTGYDVVDNDHFCNGAAAARANAPEVRCRLGLPERYFLASSRFIEKKNLPRLLNAFAMYRNHCGTDAWDLVLLGDGPQREALEQLVDELGIRGHVIFPGFQQYDTLPSYYGLAGAFVHASTTEQWGLVINEAMAAGLPVIVSENCGCTSDLVEDGKNGFTFAPSDEVRLADLMKQLATGDQVRRDMGWSSQEIISRWSPRTFANGIWQAAEKAASLPPRKASLLDQTILWKVRGKAA